MIDRERVAAEHLQLRLHLADRLPAGQLTAYKVRRWLVWAAGGDERYLVGKGGALVFVPLDDDVVVCEWWRRGVLVDRAVGPMDEIFEPPEEWN